MSKDIQGSLFIKSILLLNGVVALLGWNSILSSLDYFGFVFQRPVFFYYPLFYNCVYNVVGAIMPIASKWVSYKKRVIVSQTLMNIFLVVLLLIPMFYKGGYILSVVVIMIIAVFNMVLQSSFY